MDPFVAGIVSLFVIISLVVLGVRVAYAAGITGLFGLVLLIGSRKARDGGVLDWIDAGWSAGAGLAGTLAHSEVSHYSLSVLPMFILIGFLAYYAGLTQGAFRCARAWLGWLPGGLAVATVFATAGFAAVSGASTATAAVFSRVAIPEMLKYGYDPRLAAGVVAAGGTLASLIPPSAILVIYAIIVEESVGSLLLAGFIPGAVSAIVYAAIIVIRCKISPDLGRPVAGLNWGERINSLPGMMPIVGVIAIILGGIYTGWMTPTETGAVGAFIVFCMALARRLATGQGMTRTDFRDAMMETSKLTVMIFTIIWSILIFVRFLGFTGLTTAFADWIVHLDVAPVVVVILILCVYIVLGMFMDGIGMLLLTLPVVHPAVLALGYDPIWFGIIVVKMVEIGLVTPPIGLNCFVVNGVRPDIPLEQVFKGIWPFVVADIITVAVLIAFPGIVLYLPHLMLANVAG
ncbi:MAG: TRAP transporter large permease [Alphaproteobacteria bacterium]|nr:TRAP transporter large permease [Alphaproteobacteria bacterium]MCB9928935.1 TRAP transporter large permease [Alphaproteobacteria bacterium]